MHTTTPTICLFTCLFHLYFLTKSSLKSPLTLPSSIIQQFFTSQFLRATIPTIYTKPFFLPQPFSQFRLPQGTRELSSITRTDTDDLIFLFFSKVWTMTAGLTITDSLSLRIRKLVYCCLQSEWQTIQSTFSHNLSLLPLLPYPTNIIRRTHIPLESNRLTIFSS